MEAAQVVSVFLFAMTVICAVFAWLWNRSEKNRDDLIQGHGKGIADLKRDLAAHQLHVAQSYVTQSELARSIEKLEKTVDKLLDAINQMSRDSKEAFAELHRRVDGKEDK